MQIVEEEEHNNEENRRLYSNFIYSLKTEVSRKTYLKCLKYYMKFLGVHTFKDLVDKPQKIIESDIKEYLVYLTDHKEDII